MLKATAGFIALIGLVAAIGLTGVTPPAYGHGGKTHGGEAFTAFQALEKATELYDRLIASGKLTEEWETGLKNPKESHAVSIFS